MTPSIPSHTRSVVEIDARFIFIGIASFVTELDAVTRYDHQSRCGHVEAVLHDAINLAGQVVNRGGRHLRIDGNRDADHDEVAIVVGFEKDYRADAWEGSNLLAVTVLQLRIEVVDEV